MLTDRHFPYSSMQEINLDWILTKVKNILRFVPDDGAVGQILRRTAHGAEWSDEQGGGGAVSSVNGQTGAVVLTASDVGALPDTYAAPVDSVNGQTGAVVLDAGDVGALPDTYAAPVDSVNGQTGTVVLAIPSDTADLTNTAGFVDAAGAAAAAPVQSVNGQTGAVVLGKSDVGLGSVDNVQQYSASNPPPYPVTSVNGQTGDVVITTGGRTLLWTNPNPSASFAPQTIPLPSHSHSAYQIVCKFRYNAAYSIGPFEGLVGETVLMNSPACSNIINGSFTGFILRRADTSASQIVFGTGEIAYNTGTTNNDYMIPLRVYGID